MAAPAHTGMRVIGVGASAGGVDALLKIVSGLPEDFPHAILIVLHLPEGGRSVLASILNRSCALDVTTAGNGDAIEPGRVIVAPPERHLLVRGGRVGLSRGPKENGSRPSVDVLLRSLAEVAGARSAAVILSGALGDGSDGAVAIARAGGTLIVQDPDDALVPSMPERALTAIGDRDHVVASADEIAELLAELPHVEGELRDHMLMGEQADDAIAASRERPEGPATGFTCPECSGALWEIRDGDLVRYRCRVGHAYSEDSMLAAQGGTVEAALWTALEALEERAEMLQRIADRRLHRQPRTKERMLAAAEDALARGELIRRALSGGERPDAFAVGDEDVA